MKDEFLVTSVRTPLSLEMLAVVSRMRKFDPNQPRDDWGRWTDAGGSGFSPSEDSRMYQEAPVIHPMKSVEEIATFFDAKTMPMDISDPKTVDHAASMMMREFDYQVTQGHTGLDWYDKHVDEAFEITQQRIPELADPINRLLFSVVAGIQSQQTDVNTNWNYAAQCFESYLQSRDANGDGQFPLRKENGAKWGLDAKEGSLRALNGLIRDMGAMGALSYIYGTHTVAELNSMRQNYGTKSNTVAGKADDEVRGLVAFGPKVGPFAMNMTGIDDSALTADLWVARTLRRLTGTFHDSSGELRSDAPSEIERRFGQQVYARVAQSKGVSVKGVQAVMWVYEQKLWGKLGGNIVEAKNFVDGAREYINGRD